MREVSTNTSTRQRSAIEKVQERSHEDRNSAPSIFGCQKLRHSIVASVRRTTVEGHSNMNDIKSFKMEQSSGRMSPRGVNRSQLHRSSSLSSQSSTASLPGTPEVHHLKYEDVYTSPSKVSARAFLIKDQRAPSSPRTAFSFKGISGLKFPESSDSPLRCVYPITGGAVSS